MKTFRNLSETQSRVFEQIAINNDEGHPARTLKSLERMGLIISRKLTISAPGLLSLKIKRYDVPIPIHMEWCKWCSEI